MARKADPCDAKIIARDEEPESAADDFAEAETGTCSTISMPKPSRPATLRGWLVSRRMRLRLRSREDLRADADFALGAALAFGQRGQALFVVELQRQLLAELLDGVALRGLVQIDERAAAFVGDAAHGAVDGVAASAPGGAENVSH